MTDPGIMPGSWSDWMDSLGQLENNKLSGSASILRNAKKFSRTCGISMEAAVSQLLWLGSVAMLNHVRIEWPSGIWQPAGLMVATVEEDGVGLDLITNAVINAAHRLGLDPIQDTAKEGPAGLIARLERKPARWAEQLSDSKENENDDNRGYISGPTETTSRLEQLSRLDVTEVGAARISNAGNVRGLIYPSGRAFLSYLYDTPFFNALDELTQHGNLHVRGKHDQHRLKDLSLALFTGFYQGALANLISDYRVQNNLTMLLRQMVVLWDTSGIDQRGTQGHVGRAVASIEETAGEGLGFLDGLSAPVISAPALLPSKHKAYISDGVGVRFVGVNRYERLVRMAIGVAFWRIADGDINIEITEADCAVADAILHCHDMGARLLEIAASKGKVGSEVMRLFCRLLDGESLAGDSIQFANSTTQGEAALNMLGAMSIITKEGKLADEYRFVNGDTITAHLRRWNLTE